MKFLLTRILWLRRSKWQFLLAGFAFFIGICTLMAALNAYLRFQALKEKQEQGGHYLMLNKKISMVNTLGIEPGTFETKELDNIRRSGLFLETGEVYSNKFRAQIVSNEYIQFQSLVFFESVPNPFIDNLPAGFRWKEGEKDLPIIVSQDFLNLYNFGFALGQGLPQVGREALKLLNFEVILDGPGGREIFKGRIVGFSDRIASVLVPASFMNWANRSIGAQKEITCNRVVVKVANPSNPKIGKFLKKFRLSTSQEKMQLGKSASILDMVMKGLSVLGLLFSMLALVMFSTNFRLVMAEAESDIRLLIELGYAHRSIAFQLLFWFALLLLLVFGGACLVLFRLEDSITNAISIQGLGNDSVSYFQISLFSGLIFTVLVMLWNGLLILNHLRKIA
jgi:hypothetical protein